MSPLPLLTIAILLVAFVASAVLLFRSSETRVGLLSGALALLAVHPAVVLWQRPVRFLAADAATAVDAALLLAALLCASVVAALWRTLGERDRIEAIHWDAMEGMRALGELGASPSASLDQNLARLLEIGCACFGVELGVAARVGGKRYEVVAIRAPADFPVGKGAVFPLEETCCAGVLAGARPLAFSGGPDASPPSNAFRFEAYLGAPIGFGDAVYGTLCFGSLAARARRFTATDKDLLRVMAQWLGFELGRHASAPARRPARAAGVERSGRLRRRASSPAHRVDLNAVLGRVHRRLEQAAGQRIEIELRTAANLRTARDQQLPLDAIVLSLAHTAVDAMPDGAKLVLETANLEVGPSDPGIVPALVPNPYVTLSVRATGAALDGAALARVFEATAPETQADGRLPLATAYRLLQRCGGDLSVSVEPGRGSEFTLFLPLAEAVAGRPRESPASPLEPPAPPGR